MNSDHSRASSERLLPAAGHDGEGRHRRGKTMAEEANPSAAGPKDQSATAERDDDSASFTSDDSISIQAGVKGIEAISRSWTEWALIAAYTG